jgi:hypothetical protein
MFWSESSARSQRGALLWQVRQPLALRRFFLIGRCTRQPFGQWQTLLSPLYKLSLSRDLGGSNHSQVFDLLGDQESKFGQKQPCVLVL